MSAVRLVVLLAVAGCGRAPECNALFTGNFSDNASGKAVCPTATSEGELRFEAGAELAATRLGVSLELGAHARAGTFTSQSLAGGWKASATRDPGCVYAAGGDAVPRGQFTLVLDAIDPAKGVAHGTLSLLLGVHALDGFDCGARDAEQVDFEF